MFLFQLSGGGLNTEQERLKSLNADYRYNGRFWYYHGKFYSWIEALDNEYIRQKLQWMVEDIEAGYSNFYYREIYLQQRIEQPWINELCLNHFSNDDFKNLADTNIYEMPSNTANIISRDKYQNIYSNAVKGAGYFVEMFYDLRVNELNNQLKQQRLDVFQAQDLFLIELERKAKQYWQPVAEQYNPPVTDGKSLPNFIEKIEDKSITGQEPWFHTNYLTFSADEYIHLAKTYFEGFTFREELSDKPFKVFTKPIDEQYQWALSLFASKGLLWEMSQPILLIIRNTQNKPIKPKDVIYQEHLLFFHNRLPINQKSAQNPILQVQRFNFINHYINRYIDWMQPKVITVIYA